MAGFQLSMYGRFWVSTEVLTAEGSRQGVRYTRYMDDLFCSSGRRLRSFVGVVRKAVRDIGYQLAEDKIRYWGPSSPATLAGVVLGTTLSPTPEFIQDVETLLGKMETGQMRVAGVEIAQLQGMIAWVRALDSLRGNRLRARLRTVEGRAH